MAVSGAAALRRRLQTLLLVVGLALSLAAAPAVATATATATATAEREACLAGKVVVEGAAAVPDNDGVRRLIKWDSLPLITTTHTLATKPLALKLDGLLREISARDGPILQLTYKPETWRIRIHLIEASKLETFIEQFLRGAWLEVEEIVRALRAEEASGGHCLTRFEFSAVDEPIFAEVFLISREGAADADDLCLRLGLFKSLGFHELAGAPGFSYLNPGSVEPSLTSADWAALRLLYDAGLRNGMPITDASARISELCDGE